MKRTFLRVIACVLMTIGSILLAWGLTGCNPDPGDNVWTVRRPPSGGAK